MKKLMIAALASTLAIASAADAGGWGQKPTINNNTAHGGHAVQGQAQGQSQTLRNRNTTTINGGNYEESAYAPTSLAGDCGFGLSAGVPGAVAGISIPGKHCRVLVETALIQEYWGKQAAAQHLVDNNSRIRRTVKKQQAATGRLSTRNRSTTVVLTPNGENR